MTSTAAANEPPGSTKDCVLPSGEVRGSERVDDLFDTWSVQRNLLVVGIAEMSERELVVTTLIRLKSNFATRTPNGLGQLARGFLVFLRLVIHLERTSPAKNKRSRDPSVSRTSERLSTMHIGLQDHSPLMDLLPLDLCAGEGHLDDLACFRAQHITIAILTLHTKDGVFTRSACM